MKQNAPQKFATLVLEISTQKVHGKDVKGLFQACTECRAAETATGVPTDICFIRLTAVLA